MQDLENLIDDRFKRFKQFQPVFLSLNYFKAEIESQKQLQNNKTSLYLSHNANKSILEWKQQVNNYKYLFYADNLLALFSLKYTINENWSIKGSLNGDKEGVMINLQGQFINEQNYLSSIFSLRNDHTYKLGLKYKYVDDKNQMLLKTHLEFIVGSLFNLSKLDFSANKSYNQYTFYSGGNIEKQFNLWSGLKRSINNATIYLNFLQFDYRSAILMLHWKVYIIIYSQKIIQVQLIVYPQGQNYITNQCLLKIILNLELVQNYRNLSQIRQVITYTSIEYLKQIQIKNKIKINNMDQKIGLVMQFIAIVAFAYGTFTTFLQPLLPQHQYLFFPRSFFNLAPGAIFIILLVGISIYLYKKTQKKKQH